MVNLGKGKTIGLYLTEEEQALLEELRRKKGLNTNTELLRNAIQAYASQGDDNGV